jgi:tripartite-type tricarboxylate transporter receptor subunit TctC
MRSFAKATILLGCMLAAICGASLGGASAADYPTRTVTLIVPYPPGGGVDAMARVVAAKLTEALKQQVVVENNPGGGGTIGTRIAAQGAPDGYTLLLGHTVRSRSTPASTSISNSTRARISRRSG